MKQEIAEIVLGLVMMTIVFGAGWSAGHSQSLADELQPAGQRVEAKIDDMAKKIDAIYNKQAKGN